MNSASTDEQGKNTGTTILPAGDLIEFYWRWQEFRPIAVKISRLAGLSEIERATVHWMMALIDRIGERDLAGAERGGATDQGTKTRKPARLRRRRNRP